MALSYDPAAKKWNGVDDNGRPQYENDQQALPDPIILWIVPDRVGVVYNDKQPNSTGVAIPYGSTPKETGNLLAATFKKIMSGDSASRVNWYEKNVGNISEIYDPTYVTTCKVGNDQPWCGSMKNPNVSPPWQNSFINLQKITTELATTIKADNYFNTVKNQSYDRMLSTASSTRGGDYVDQRAIIRDLPKLDEKILNTLSSTQRESLLSRYEQFKKQQEDTFKAFYTTEKLQTWDFNLGAKPPYGTFDPNYYKAQNPTVAQQWQSAVANDDVDITQRYGENGYYLQHYTTVGKTSGARGNKAEDLEASKQYVETKPTDADLQQVRNLQLGVDTDTQTERLLNTPEIAAEWEKAKAGDTYWKQKAKESFLDIDKPEEFAALFRLSDRREDKEIAFKYNVNAGYGITELEDALNEAVGEKATVDVKKFGALTQDVLKQTIDEMKRAKAREQEMSMFSGFGVFSDITNINKDLTNSILGDSGVGGVLSYMGGGKAEESLEKALRGITGVNNNVTYNWQQWFDNTLKERYQSDLELGLSAEDAQNNVKIQGEFAREFIDKYLIPRFNESRSMNEFVDYLDVRQSEQNPFQTQDILNATKLVADIRAQQFLDQLKQTPERYFDSEFYFNPTGDKAREASYAEQAATVAADWEAAKSGDAHWKSQAYRFGVNVDDKDAFARMHFQIKGQGKGYDAADDILNASKVSEYIYGQILPTLKEEALKQGTVFGQFIKPDEFANEMLKGLDPDDKNTWNDILKRYGLTDFKGNLEELKAYITEALRTGSAQEIREQIKYLNEKRQKPTQEKLGISYIQREEDYKPDAQIKGDTQLYKTFQNAGFKGTEDEFYENFFPDLDRSEQAALTKAGKNEGLKTSGLNLSDPYASLDTLESFFSTSTDKITDKEETKKSYFTIDTDEDLPTKTESGQGFLDEFTSLFKGFG
jgi:hypothetical protein